MTAHGWINVTGMEAIVPEAGIRGFILPYQATSKVLGVVAH